MITVRTRNTEGKLWRSNSKKSRREKERSAPSIVLEYVLVQIFEEVSLGNQHNPQGDKQGDDAESTASHLKPTGNMDKKNPAGSFPSIIYSTCRFGDARIING